MNTADNFVMAQYLVYDHDYTTMSAIPFENGHMDIQIDDTGAYTVQFMYTLKEKETGKLITLKGNAQFNTQQLASGY